MRKLPALLITASILLPAAAWAQSYGYNQPGYGYPNSYGYANPNSYGYGYSNNYGYGTGGAGNISPAERDALRQRLANLTPEQRARLIERLRLRRAERQGAGFGGGYGRPYP
ncbi:hypothetical protein [Gloeobacter kilaueensis]|uniref:Zinc resistance-associated protein n=1 Tax=Gloeobacter kilaueensis (strain ATCC BAA-2537 / CCAP 1431/1 / ULC 316 / JS1) TaxID=1183438 RepID=U5QGL1_GLOK1|nr:hypothetical protein [Gloeobacter kilaueensis]AGY56769.1 hypothetical protein GKIL_0523 [Gloeobacter kilaueensis JS1]